MNTEIIISVVMTFFALFATLATTTKVTAADSPPNIVLIISDDQSWTDYGFMGHKAIESPNLDKLARESVTFRRGDVPTALCRPSLATLVTGLYAHQHGITGNDPARTAENRAGTAERTGVDARELLISNIDKHPTLPRVLAEKGYLSFQCGKWWEGSYQRGGFTHASPALPIFPLMSEFLSRCKPATVVPGKPEGKRPFGFL